MNDLTVIEQNGQRVLTTSQLAESFGTDSRIISNNFNRNKSRYTHGKHFFALDGDSKRDFINLHQIDDGSKNAMVLYLWTEKGAWMHAKSLNTDQAWEAYELLVDDYYSKTENIPTEIDISKLTPELQLFHRMFNVMAQVEFRAIENERKLNAVTQTVEAMQETFLQRDEDWRRQVNSLITSAAFRNQVDYNNMRTRSYQLLEERAHCDLDSRLRNLKKRLEHAGATKTQITKTNRMDVIEEDACLKEIYRTIAKELNMGSMRVVSVQ